jgi:hypothetical protein
MRPRNPIQSLRVLADWCEQCGVRPEEVVCLSCDSFDKPTAHLHFAALIRIWPEEKFRATCYEDTLGPMHVTLDDVAVRVCCVVQLDENAGNEHRIIPQAQKFEAAGRSGG